MAFGATRVGDIGGDIGMADEVEYDVEAEAGGQTVSNGYAEEAESAPVQAAASVAESDDDEELRRMKRRERFALESAAGTDAEAAKGKGSRRERDAPARSARDAPARGPAPEIEGSEIIGRFRRCFRCNKRFGAHDVSSFQCHKCGDHPVPRAGNPGGQGAEAADGGERPPPTSLDEKLPKCYNCGGEGHLRRNCPEPRRKNDGREGDAAAADAGEEGEGEEGGRKRRRGEREAPSKAPVQVEGSALIQVGLHSPPPPPFPFHAPRPLFCVRDPAPCTHTTPLSPPISHPSRSSGQRPALPCLKQKCLMP